MDGNRGIGFVTLKRVASEGAKVAISRSHPNTPQPGSARG